MNLYEVFILSVFDFSMMFILYNKLFPRLIINNRNKALYIGGGALMVAIISVFVLNSLQAQLAIQVFVFLYFGYIAKNKKIQISRFTTAYIIVTITCFMVQFSVVMAFNLVMKDIEVVFLNGLLFQSIGLILVYLLARRNIVTTIFEYIDQKNIWAQVIIFNLLIVFVGLTFFWYMNPQSLLDAALYIMIIGLLMLLITSNLLNNGVIDKERKEKLQIYETYIPIINSIVEKMRVTQHDYNNQVQIIHELKKIHTLDEKTNQYLEAYKIPIQESKLIFIENKIVMALLYSKMNEAENLGVDLSLEISNYYMTSVHTDYEIVEMYSILLTNAIEALEDEEKKEMIVRLDFKDNRNVFIVSNIVSQFQANDISKMFRQNESTKDKDRGIGLYKLSSILSKHKGEVNAYYEGDSKMLTLEICHH